MHQLWLASSGTSVGTANVSATALRFFFKITLKRHDLAEELISTREPRRLPVVLSPEEVGRLLAAATNTKHRAILSLAYATGLRASEVVSLKLTDIDRDRMVIRVEQGKGKKDRYVILSPILLEILHEWWRVARKKGWMSPAPPWLFPGYRHDDRDRRCRPLGGEWGQGSESDDHIHIEADQFGSKHWQPVAIVIRGPILECKVLAFDSSELAKAVAEHAVQMCLRPQRSLRCGCQSCRPSPLAGPASCSATRRSRRP